MSITRYALKHLWLYCLFDSMLHLYWLSSLRHFCIGFTDESESECVMHVASVWSPSTPPEKDGTHKQSNVATPLLSIGQVKVLVTPKVQRSCGCWSWLHYFLGFKFNSIQFICIAQFHKLQICLGVLYKSLLWGTGVHLVLFNTFNKHIYQTNGNYTGYPQKGKACFAAEMPHD